MIKIALGILLAVIVYKIVVGILRAPGKAIDSFNENIDRKLQKLDAEKKAQEEAAYREEMRRIALMSDEEKKLRSDIIIDNSGPISQLEEELKTFFTKFSKNS